jgi:hypothetical protein
MNIHRCIIVVVIVVVVVSMGIIEEELPHMVEFGFRGSNVINRRSLGGGCGLTKAYFYTKLFNGTFKIKV